MFSKVITKQTHPHNFKAASLYLTLVIEMLIFAQTDVIHLS